MPLILQPMTRKVLLISFADCFVVNIRVVQLLIGRAKGVIGPWSSHRWQVRLRMGTAHNHAGESPDTWPQSGPGQPPLAEVDRAFISMPVRVQAAIASCR